MAKNKKKTDAEKQDDRSLLLQESLGYLQGYNGHLAKALSDLELAKEADEEALVLTLNNIEQLEAALEEERKMSETINSALVHRFAKIKEIKNFMNNSETEETPHERS